jgi:hypothetical protein
VEVEGVLMEVGVPEGRAQEGVEGVPVEVEADDVVFVSEGTTELRKGTKRAVDVTPMVVGKRSRLPSQYIVSPFTAEAKRRTFLDGTFPNLFREVDPVRQKAFSLWFTSLQHE